MRSSAGLRLRNSRERGSLFVGYVVFRLVYERNRIMPLSSEPMAVITGEDNIARHQWQAWCYWASKHDSEIAYEVGYYRRPDDYVPKDHNGKTVEERLELIKKWRESDYNSNFGFASGLFTQVPERFDCNSMFRLGLLPESSRPSEPMNWIDLKRKGKRPGLVKKPGGGLWDSWERRGENLDLD